MNVSKSFSFCPLLKLGVTISQTDEKLDIPVDEFDGKVIYGEKRKQAGLHRSKTL